MIYISKIYASKWEKYGFPNLKTIRNLSLGLTQALLSYSQPTIFIIMLKSSSFKLLLSLLLNLYFQFTYSFGRCWEQAFVNNTVFINTIGTGDVQMGYLSQLNKLNYPNIIPSGMPKITVELLKEKCDKLGIKMCAAIQFFQCPGTWGEDKLSYDWGNLLTPEEYKASRRKGVETLFNIFIYY